MRYLIAALLALYLTDCATGPAIVWDRLSADEAAWTRCQQTIADHLCGGPVTNTGDHHGRAVCVMRLVDELQSQATPQTRRAWLLANGCPATRVTPEQIIINQQEAAAAPVARLPDSGVVFTP